MNAPQNFPQENNISQGVSSLDQQKQHTSSLIADALDLRGHYFDEKGDRKNLSRSPEKGKYYDIQAIIKRLFGKETSIEEALKLTSTPQARAYLERFQGELFEMFLDLLELVHHPSRNIAAGHDSVHSAYDSYEILNYIHSIDDPVEKIATYFGSLIHDLGRTDEIMLKGGQVLDDSHAFYSILYIIQELRNKKQDFEKKYPLDLEEKKQFDEISKAFFKRIINAVLLHPGFNDTRDPVFHHVQSLDRLAGIYGQRFFVRILMADGLHHQKPIFPDDSADYSTKLPNVFGTTETYSLFHKQEQYMRGTFHKPVSLSMEHGNTSVDEETRQSLVILMLLSGGYDTPLYTQTFHPELVNGSKEAFNNKGSGKKGVLPDTFKKLLQERQLITPEEQERLEKMSILNTYSLKDLFRIVFQQQAMFLSKTDLEAFLIYVDAQDNLQVPQKQKSLCDALKYIIVRREMDRILEIKTIQANLQNPEIFQSAIAKKSLEHPLWSVSLDEILVKLKI